MDDSLLDRLLKRHFHEPANADLSHLEQDVWRRIHARETKERPDWLEGLLAPLLVPQYRFATMAVAIALGLFAGELTNPPIPVRGVSAFNMQVFSATDGNLPSNILMSSL